MRRPMRSQGCGLAVQAEACLLRGHHVAIDQLPTTAIRLDNLPRCTKCDALVGGGGGGGNGGC